jgi:hypothetical protein
MRIESGRVCLPKDEKRLPSLGRLPEIRQIAGVAPAIKAEGRKPACGPMASPLNLMDIAWRGARGKRAGKTGRHPWERIEA